MFSSYHECNAPPCNDSADVKSSEEGIYEVIKVREPVIQCADMLLCTLQRVLKVIWRSTERAVN